MMKPVLVVVSRGCEIADEGTNSDTGNPKWRWMSLLTLKNLGIPYEVVSDTADFTKLDFTRYSFLFQPYVDGEDTQAGRATGITQSNYIADGKMPSGTGTIPLDIVSFSNAWSYQIAGAAHGINPSSSYSDVTDFVATLPTGGQYYTQRGTGVHGQCNKQSNLNGVSGNTVLIAGPAAGNALAWKRLSADGIHYAYYTNIYDPLLTLGMYLREKPLLMVDIRPRAFYLDMDSMSAASSTTGLAALRTFALARNTIIMAGISDSSTYNVDSMAAGVKAFMVAGQSEGWMQIFVTSYLSSSFSSDTVNSAQWAGVSPELRYDNPNWTFGGHAGDPANRTDRVACPYKQWIAYLVSQGWPVKDSGAGDMDWWVFPGAQNSLKGVHGALLAGVRSYLADETTHITGNNGSATRISYSSGGVHYSMYGVNRTSQGAPGTADVTQAIAITSKGGSLANWMVRCQWDITWALVLGQFANCTHGANWDQGTPTGADNPGMVWVTQMAVLMDYLTCPGYPVGTMCLYRFATYDDWMRLAASGRY